MFRMQLGDLNKFGFDLDRENNGGETLGTLSLFWIAFDSIKC